MTRLGLVGLACLAAAACGGSSAPKRTASVASQATTTSAPQPRPKARPKPKPDPGKLPQTHQLPAAGTPGFRAEMAALWRGVTAGALRPALPAFFPESAYVQVKQIADPRGDYVQRLLGGYRADLLAAHALLGHDPARLLDVRVPGPYAHWVDPGACYNRVGYYEVPNARVVYTQSGQTRSFGIASMISWRGVWYVVHLGAVVPAGAGGEVDDPSAGPGVSAPSSTC
jgi:hypothetical protein